MRIAIVSLLSLLAVACAPTSSYMHPAAGPITLTPQPAKALVVFVRPSSFAWSIGANVLDENGRFLGDALAGGWFAAALTPGHHEFTVWAENTDVISADVVAGRIYYVEVAATMGWGSAQMHLRAIKPSLSNWVHREEWMRSTKPYLPDYAAGQANLDARAADTAERLRRAREHLASYRGDALVEHTLAPNDGSDS